MISDFLFRSCLCMLCSIFRHFGNLPLVVNPNQKKLAKCTSVDQRVIPIPLQFQANSNHTTYS